MKHKRVVLSCAGSLLLVCASATHAADTPVEPTASAPTDAAATPQTEAAVNSDSVITPQTDAAVNSESAVTPQAEERMSVAAETPPDTRIDPAAERMATSSGPCADQSGSASTSMDCERLKRRLGENRTSGNLTAACSSRMDDKGNVMYDDPTCPGRIHPVVTDARSVYLTRENPFFNLHIEKAVDHARAAEIAGNQGQAIDLLEHAQMSLDRAKEAQRAGNVPGLNEAIMSLREALRLPEASSVREATAYVRDARKNLSQAGGMKYAEIHPKGVVAVSK